MDNEEKPKSRWAVPDDGMVHLHDLSFDFENYFEQYDKGVLSNDERNDYNARVYGMFCRDFFDSGGDPSAVKPWVANYLAKKLYQVLGGVPWQDIMGMPWDEPTAYLTARGKRAFDIYAGVENELNAEPLANVTDLISQQAQSYHVSYETARADYYAMKKGFKAKTGPPSKFLIEVGNSENKD